MDKKVLKEFFLSKGFASIVTILVTQFGSDELAQVTGQGVELAQNVANLGLLGGVGLAIWSRFNSAKTKVEAKELNTVIADTTVESIQAQQKAQAMAAAAEDERRKKHKAQIKVNELQSILDSIKPKRNASGKFEKK